MLREEKDLEDDLGISGRKLAELGGLEEILKVLDGDSAVLETKDGDVIAIRSLMFMSHSYDHRVVDGSLGGMFLKHVHDYLQNWDLNTEI